MEWLSTLSATLRKSKAIRAVVRKHKFGVWYLSEDQLITLRCLLEDGVFEYDSVAQSRFPELFRSPLVESASAASFNANPLHSFAYIPMDLQKPIQLDSLERQIGCLPPTPAVMHHIS